MPLIPKESRKEKIKIEISSKAMESISEYMKWSDISDIGYFFEECANYTIKSDKEWKSFKKEQMKAESASS